MRTQMIAKSIKHKWILINLTFFLILVGLNFHNKNKLEDAFEKRSQEVVSVVGYQYESARITQKIVTFYENQPKDPEVALKILEFYVEAQGLAHDQDSSYATIERMGDLLLEMYIKGYKSGKSASLNWM